MPSPTTHIVVPCYNEADRLPADEIDRWLAEHPRFRFVMVNDGSTDNTGPLLARMSQARPDQVTAIDLPANSGKAQAVRAGIQWAIEQEAPAVGYYDADLATPLDALPEMAQLLETAEVDLVLASRVRLLGRHIERNNLRHYVGRVFATAAAVTLDLPVYDTQCGAKLMRITPQTRDLFDRPFIGAWTMDVELIARFITACHDAGATPARDRMVEHPLPAWREVPGSKVKPTDLFRSLWELWLIHRRYRLRQIETTDP